MTVSELAPPARLALADVPPPSASPGPLTTSMVVAGRTVRKFLRTPKLVLLSTVQAALFLTIFRYVFGGAIGSGQYGTTLATDVPYIDYLVPGYIVGGALFSGSGVAAGVAQDTEQGFSDRLRSLPVPRVGLLTGRSLAESALVTWGMLMATAVSFLIGFRFHGSAAQAAAAFGLCVVYGFTFTWVFIIIGLLARSAQVAAGISMMSFLLTAVSSAYVPVETMPGWVQAVAENQPITIMANAVRSLVLGDLASTGLDRSAGYWVLLSLAWCAALLIVSVPLAVRCYRRA